MKFTGKIDPTFQAIVEQAHALALSKAGDKITPDIAAYLATVPVEISMKLQTTAGQAWSRRCPLTKMVIRPLIRLNYRLLSKNPGEIFFTYAHELAHIIAEFKYGMQHKVGHGPLWKAWARALGDDAGRCHNMDTSALRRAKTRYIYSCPDCSRKYNLTPARHAKAERFLARGSRLYRCSCRSGLNFTAGPVRVAA